MKLELEDFKKVWTYRDDSVMIQVANVIKYLEKHLANYGIDTELRVQHFIAQTLHESGGYTKLSENLMYSQSGLRRVFPKYFKTDLEAAEYAYKAEKIANRVYGNRLGNGPESSGEGYLYRGRGLIQLTGKSNYAKFKSWLVAPDVVARPDLLTHPNIAVLSSIWFWNSKKLNDLADRDDVLGITKKINGGTNGLQERIDLLNKVKKYIKITF